MAAAAALSVTAQSKQAANAAGRQILIGICARNLSPEYLAGGLDLNHQR